MSSCRTELKIACNHIENCLLKQERERLICSKSQEWSEIDDEKLPSQSSLLTYERLGLEDLNLLSLLLCVFQLVVQ